MTYVAAIAALFLLNGFSDLRAQQAATAPALQLATPFGDHMVLQRDLPVNVWGTAPAGADVTVTIAGQTAKASADATGKWSTALPPLKAGGPYLLKVNDGGESIQFSDVLIGEVWLCSGQSNMAWTMQNFKDRSDPTFGNDIAAADHPMVRLGSVGQRMAFTPVTNTPVRWSVCTPQSVEKYSATAYFFARALHAKLGVPIGVVNASVGGSPAEAWTDRATLDSDPAFKPAVRRLETYKDSYPRYLAAWEKKVAELKDDPGNPPMPIKPRPYEKNTHLPTVLWNSRINPLVPMTFRGVAWYQGEADATRQQSHLYAKLLPAMFKSWRAAFGRGDDLQLLVVQLPMFGADRAGLHGSHWAQIRNVQAQTVAKMKNAQLCVTLDLGKVDNEHPPTKRQLGSRLAALAAQVTPGGDPPAALAHYTRADFTHGEVTLHFADNDPPFVLNNTPPTTDFIIAGHDQVWRVATVTRDGDSLVLKSAEVPKPVAARYAWSDSPHASLTDQSGLPLAPFRTDHWPLLPDRHGRAAHPATQAATNAP